MTDIQATDKARTVTGVVVSDRMQKTITVLCQRRIRHPVYGKYITRSSKFQAHDELNSCKCGDHVTIAEVRPISKRKSWVLLRKDKEATAATRADADSATTVEDQNTDNKARDKGKSS